MAKDEAKQEGSPNAGQRITMRGNGEKKLHLLLETIMMKIKHYIHFIMSGNQIQTILCNTFSLP